ncbi:hypothetical protein Acr_29g0007310 [Actinidia rufa]|uniref:Uncharacterized protein n=1 Tax=Actinidia rufa TaxID=165716 RepID=A0A7J0HES3_9ERIC|nr:hypothetical protein Acr_29g0007310 [Actinidia rufa]
MAAESWLLGIERVFEVLPCTDEQKVILGSVQRGVFPRDGPRSEDSRVLEFKAREHCIVVYNAKFMELSRYALHIVSTESRKARRFEAGLRWNIKNKVEILRLPTHQEVLHAALIAEESVERDVSIPRKSKEEDRRNVSRGQSSKRQSSGSSSGNSSVQQRNTGTRLEIVLQKVKFKVLGHRHQPQYSNLQLKGEIISHDKVELLHLY